MLPHDPSLILVSSFIRVQNTAKPYCNDIGKKWLIYPSINEFNTFDISLIEGMNGEQRKPIVDGYWEEADPKKRNGPKAETFTEFNALVHNFIIQVLSNLPDKTVIFGHGMWFALLCWNLLGFKLCDSLNMKMFRGYQLGLPLPNGAIYYLNQLVMSKWVIRVDEDKMRAVSAINPTTIFI